jgi:predicted small secreted protein
MRLFVRKIHQPHAKENAMLAKFVLLLATLSFASISLNACNTVQGAGKDVEKAGVKVQEEAQEHKKY